MASEAAAPSVGPAAPTKAKDQATQGGQKLSNAELKKKAKEEKAARRAASKTTSVTAPSPSGSPSAHQGTASDSKGAKPKPKHDASGPHGHSRLPHRPAASSAAAGTSGTLASVGAPHLAAQDGRLKATISFGHLPIARRIPITQADKDVHAAVLEVGQCMSHFSLPDSISRLEATLIALKEVVDSYSTPRGATFSRHFTAHILNPQIDYLTACRPLCFSMGNAIRWLKRQVSKIDIDLPDSEAKYLLCQLIDNFIRERIKLARLVLASKVADTIKQDDIVLTFAYHDIVKRALLVAKNHGKSFRAIIADDPWKRDGQEFATLLTKAGIPVTYATDVGRLGPHLASATKVFVGAEAIFSNGAMYARAGTCDLAVACSKYGMEVTALCETISFTERLPIDTLTYNEMDPERSTNDECRLLFDVTSNNFVSSVMCEIGTGSPGSVPVILRKLEIL